MAALRVEEQRMVDVEVENGVRRGVSPPQPHEAARAVVTMCTALAQWFRRDGEATAEQIAAQYVDFALDLVRCDPPYHRTIGVGRSPIRRRVSTAALPPPAPMDCGNDPATTTTSQILPGVPLAGEGQPPTAPSTPPASEVLRKQASGSAARTMAGEAGE